MQPTRRSFMKSASMAALGASALAGSIPSVAKAQTGRPFVTGVRGKKLVCCYVSASEMLNEPKYIDALQKQLGVNAVIISPPAIKMPDWLKEMNPLKGKGWMGTSPVKDDDDSQLVKGIEEAHRRGLDVWLYYTGHHYGQLYRPACAVTFDGIPFNELPPIKYALCQGLVSVCFNKPEVVEWDRTAYTYGARTYDVDAIYVTHFRYANPAFFTNLFGCACEDCRKLAADMGRDFNAMERASRNLVKNLRKLDAAKVKLAAKIGLTFTDFLQMLADDRAIMDWIYFRSDTVGMRLRGIHDSIREATAGRSQFISDTHNPTQALFVGHNYADLMNGASDALLPLAWLDFQHMSAVAALANLLVTWVPGLDEESALTAMLTFFGWNELPIPRKRIADYRIGVDSASHKDTEFYEIFNKESTLALWTHELEHLALMNTKGMPSIPIIKGHQWTEKISRELMDRCMSLGHTGYTLQRTDLFIDKKKL